MQDAAQTLSKREFLIFLYKYRLRLLLGFLIPFTLMVAISFIPTPRYKASAVLIVRMGSEYVYQPATGITAGSPTANIPLGSDQIFKSEVAILKSDSLHQRVIDKLGIETVFPELVHPTGFSLIMAKLRQEFDNLMPGEKPLALSTETAQRKLLTQAVERFDKRFDILLEKDSAVISLSFEHKDDLMAEKVLVTLLDLYLDKRKELYAEPRTELAENDMTANRNRALSATRAVEEFKRAHNIYSLPEQRADLLRRREEARKQSQAIANPALEHTISDYTRQLDQLDVDERQLTNLEKQAEISASAYSLYSSKRDEAKAHDNFQRERLDSVRIIQPPMVDAEPKRLQPLIILGGFFLSLLCMLALAALTEFSRNGFFSPEQVERELNLPVLAAIPAHKNSQLK